MFALTKLAIDDEALCVTPVSTDAIEVDAERSSEESARLPEVSVPAVSVRVPYAQTSAAVNDPPLVPSIEPIDVDAVVTIALVFPFTTAAIDDDADDITLAIDEVATATRESVFALTAEVTPAVCVFVLALTSATTEEEAVCISLCVASDPAVNSAPVSVRVAELHTSDASEPKLESVRVPAAQTAVAVSAAKVPNVVSDREVKLQIADGSIA